MSQEQLAPHEQSTRQLLAELVVQAAALLGQEYALAKAELRATARKAGMGGVLLGAAGGLGISAWLVLLVASVAGIAVVLPVWAAALIVGGGLAVISGALALAAGRWLARVRPALPLTMESLRQDLREAADRARR